MEHDVYLRHVFCSLQSITEVYEEDPVQKGASIGCWALFKSRNECCRAQHLGACVFLAMLWGHSEVVYITVNWVFIKAD